MPKKSLYFTKALQCKVIKSLVIYWIKVRELWVVCVRVLRHFSVFLRIHAPILPTNYKKITKHFQCGYKQRQDWNTERIMQFFKIAAYVQIARLYSLVHYAACAFLPYIHGLRLALVGEYGLSGCFMRYWLVWALSAWERESVSVFDGLVYL